MTNSPSTSRPVANRVSDAKDILPADPVLLAVAAKLLQQAAQAEDVGSLLQAGFPGLAAAIGADYVALVAPDAGRWAVVAEWGIREERPTALTPGPSPKGRGEL